MLGLMARKLSLTIRQGEFVPTHMEYSLPSVYRIFAATKLTFICEENLWVSDSDVQSHYQITHKKNKGRSLQFSQPDIDLRFRRRTGRDH